MTTFANTTGPQRPTLEKIQTLAESHVAYGWSSSPGSHDRNILWTDEDTETYMKFYRAAAKTKA